MSENTQTNVYQSTNNENKSIIGVSKYKNIMGVTCYMNSILHILQQVPIFMEYISQAQFKDTINRKINIVTNNQEEKEGLLKNYVIFELFRLFKNSLENDDSIITPTSLKKVIGTKNDMWNEINHQDSQEFFTFLISQLEEEAGVKTEFIPGLSLEHTLPGIVSLSLNDSISNILASSSWTKFQSKEYSPLKNMFDGLSESNKQCICCKTVNTVYEPFITLSLSIPIKSNDDFLKSFDIYECLDYLMKEEQLDEDNKINCEMCGIKNRGLSRTLLWKTPKILVLHIKRFMVNSYGITTRKLTNNIRYPIKDLDLNKYFNQASPYKDQSKYDLVGINMHFSFGNAINTNTGHYMSLVKNLINHNWYLYNDSDELKMITSSEHLQNPNAYLLFYYRHN